MSKDRLLSALNASELVKESENMPDPTRINKTIREMRKENRDEGKILFRDLKLLLEPGKGHYQPVKNVNAFNNNYIEYESNGDKNNLCLNKIKPCLSNMINDLKTQGEWKIELAM